MGKLRSLDEADYNDFKLYFDKHESRPTYIKSWPKCYKDRDCPSINMALEHFHMVLKYKYLNSKQGRRLDNLINTLVKKGKDDIKRRFNKIQCSSYSFRDKDVQAAHLRGISIHDVDIINCGSGGWKVRRQFKPDGVADNRYYDVQILGDICKEVRCLPCRVCKVCRHMLKCSCYDYTINDNVCKHIHACISRNPHAVAPRYVDTEQELARMVKYFQTNAPDYGRNLAAKKKSIILAIQNESDPDRVEGYCATFELAGVGKRGRDDPANKSWTPQRGGAVKRRRFDFKK